MLVATAAKTSKAGQHKPAIQHLCAHSVQLLVTKLQPHTQLYSLQGLNLIVEMSNESTSASHHIKFTATSL
jgi:hypothetical protein